MEFDVEMTPGKVWLLRKTSQACLDNGRPEKALSLAEKGLELRPDDEDFKNIKAEAEQDLKKKCSVRCRAESTHAQSHQSKIRFAWATLSVLD